MPMTPRAASGRHPKATAQKRGHGQTHEDHTVQKAALMPALCLPPPGPALSRELLSDAMYLPPPGPALSRELPSDAMYLPPPGPALSRKLPSDTVYRPTPGPTQAPLLSLYTCTVLSCCHAGEVQCRQPAQSAQCLEASYGGSLLTAGGTHGCFHWPGAPPSGGRALCRFTCHQALWFCPSGPQVPGQATSRPRGGRQQCP